MKHYLTKTAYCQIFLKILSTVLLLAPGWGNNARAQCTAPDDVAHTSTTATCPSNGRISVGQASGGSGSYLEYALYNAANATEVRPWQTDTLFADLAPGSYTLRARYVCLLGVGNSSEYTKPVTVSGSYTPPSITGITVQRRAQCNNGRILIIAAGGTNPKMYALVAGLNTPEPVAQADYIRQPQASNIFDSLPAGTYYVRVYDACGSYATNTITVNSFTQANPFVQTFRIAYWFCDSLSGEIYLNNLPDHVPGTGDTLKRLWVTFPDGSSDTINVPAPSGSPLTYVAIPLSKLGPVGPGKFPDNIGGTWPKPIRTSYKDACGNVFTRDYSMSKPGLTVSFFSSNFSTLNTCDSSAYTFALYGNGNGGSNSIGVSAVNMNSNAFYSLDSGSTWQAVTTTGYLSQDIPLLIGSSYNACLAFCGDTICLTGTVPPLQLLNTKADESNQYACFGNSGFSFYANQGAVLPVAVEMISGPAGQTWVTDSLTSNSNSYLTSSRNMLPGDYIFRFTDACGRIKYDTLSTAYPFPVFDYSYTFPCGGTDMEISFTNDSIKWLSNNNSKLSTFSLGFRGQLYRAADSTLANQSQFYNNNATGKLTIPGSVIASLPNDNYFIRIWKSGADSCTFIDKPWEKTNSLISLSNSLTVSSCPGTASTGTIIAIAQGTAGGESYSLYNGSVSDSTLVAGPQSSAIFNNLNESTTYIVTVSDSCGRGSQASLSFNGTPLPVYNNAEGKMPCPGDSLALVVNNMPEVKYQWYKNDTLLPGDTMRIYSVSNIQASDSGEYKARLNIGTCNIFLASFRLAPGECGTPLRVSFLSFTARPVGEKVVLDWSTATERSSKGFAIERSANGTDWNTIGYVASLAANGNSSEQLVYAYEDYNPIAGISYYRLRQIDIDGNFSYSDTRQVLFRAGGQQLQLYPNPTRSGLTIEGLEDGEVIKVYNALGQQVRRQAAVQPKVYLDLSGLQNGIYQVQVTTPTGNSTTYSVVKKGR